MTLADPISSTKSVYQIDYWTDASITAAAAVAGAVPYFISGSLITPRCPCDPKEVNSIDRPAIGNNSAGARLASDVTLLSSMALPFMISTFEQGVGTPEFWEDTLVVAQSLAVAGAMVSLTKHAVGRPIPRVYSGHAPASDPNQYRSFYSGHTVMAFTALSATAMTLNLRYDWGAWPWIAVGAIGSSVAWERVAGGSHFLSDVVVGGLIGTATGVFIPLLHKKDIGGGSLTAIPTPDGVQLLWAKRI